MNVQLFAGSKGKLPPMADAVNEAGGKAYAQGAEATLALIAATGTLNDQAYTAADEQLALVLETAGKCSAEYVARCAVFARQRGFMKDMPALLLAHLAGRKEQEAQLWLGRAFPVVIDNGKMLRNFVQMIRSGVTGRKSLGSQPRRLVANWLLSRSPDDVFRHSVGDKPSMADVIKLSRPKPRTAEQRALFGYLLGREVNAADLPPIVVQLEAWRKGEGGLPRVPWEMLTSGTLTLAHWRQIVRNASWTQLRMNLNTFKRHGCWDDPALVEWAAKRLADPDLVRKARCFPYQLLAAYTYATDIPQRLRLALQDAMEVACENVPAIEGVLHIYPDVSGSMQSPVTGARGSATSLVRCIDAAALIAAALLRKNSSGLVIPFNTAPIQADMNPRDSIMTNAKRLAAYGGGGTDCSVPLRAVLEPGNKIDLPDVAVFVSDNESWAGGSGRRGTTMMEVWHLVLAKKPKAKLICIDLAAYPTVQAKGDGVMNVGGFSDAVFDAMASFAAGTLTDADWVGSVKAVKLDAGGVPLLHRKDLATDSLA